MESNYCDHNSWSSVLPISPELFKLHIHRISLEIYKRALTREALYLCVAYIDKVQFYLEK